MSLLSHVVVLRLRVDPAKKLACLCGPFDDEEGSVVPPKNCAYAVKRNPVKIPNHENIYIRYIYIYIIEIYIYI